MRSIFAAVLLLAFVTCPDESIAADQSPASTWGVQQLMQSMTAIKSSRKKFTERKYMSVLTKPLESSGTLSYDAPARLEKHTQTPRDERMVLDHGIIVIEGPAGQVRRTMMVEQYPAIGAFVESIRATLAGDLQALEHYYRLRLEGGAEHWRLQLVPIDAATREVVREIRMEGRDNQIGSIEIFEASGDRSVMTVTGE
jgi:hypothetical protein